MANVLVPSRVKAIPGVPGSLGIIVCTSGSGKLTIIGPGKLRREESAARKKPVPAAATSLTEPMPALPAETRDRRASGSGANASKSAEKSAGAYKLEFSLRELASGKRVNTRNYTMTVEDGSWGKIRVGNRVPFEMPGPEHTQVDPAGRATVVGSTQYQYQDVGVKIDCRPRVREKGLSLDLTVELSSVLKPEETGLPVEHLVFRNNSFSSNTVVPFGKATVVGTLDDVTSDRRYEIEITATQVK